MMTLEEFKEQQHKLTHALDESLSTSENARHTNLCRLLMRCGEALCGLYESICCLAAHGGNRYDAAMRAFNGLCSRLVDAHKDGDSILRGPEPVYDTPFDALSPEVVDSYMRYITHRIKVFGPGGAVQRSIAAKRLTNVNYRAALAPRLTIIMQTVPELDWFDSLLCTPNSGFVVWICPALILYLEAVEADLLQDMS